MRRVWATLCAAILLSLPMPAPAGAASIESNWWVDNEPFGVTIDPRDGTVYVAISDHNKWNSPEYMWAIDPTFPLPYDPPAIPIPRFILPTPQATSALDT